MNELVGRAGLAKILNVSESTTRNLERRGQIKPDLLVGGRPLYSVTKALKLKRSLDNAATR